MRNHKLATLLAGIDTLPTLPAIVGQVTQTIVNPESSARDLMELIRPDQALTLKILKIANSAFYGQMRASGTLEQAILVLGFDEIRNLVISTALFNNFRTLKVTPRFNVGRFWKHAFVCGLAARMIAKKMQLAESELFVAGLTHDIGKLVICSVLPMEFASILEITENDDLKTLSAELEILGITHEEVGARLAKRWWLPAELVTAVGYHHRPAEAPAKAAYPIVIHMADALAHYTSAPETPQEPRTRDGIFSPEVVYLAQSRGMIVHPDAVNQLAAELEAQKQAQAGILDIFLS